MKTITRVMAVCAAFTLAASAVQAQTAEAQAGSVATSGSQSASVAGAQGGSVNIAPTPRSTEQTVRQPGRTDTRLENAPALGGLALGGGHPCAYSPATAQLSIIGGAAGFGGMTIDSACMLLVQAAATGDKRAYEAAIYMIAARDDDACKALYKSGMISDCVDRNGKSTVRAATVSTRNAPTRPKARPVSLDVECRRSGNTITPVTTKAVMDFYGRDAVMGACK